LEAAVSKTLGVPMVPGPLAVWAETYAEWLVGRGYAPLTVKRALRDAARLSRWLDRERLGVGELTAERVELFLRAQREAGFRTLTTPARLRRPLEFLREVGAAPMPAPLAVEGPVETLLAGYRRYLIGERGLAPATVLSYESNARLFLASVQERRVLDPRRLTAADVVVFLACECPQRSCSQARQLVVALRSLLRYLHVEGLTEGPLQWVVPAVADQRDRSLPKALDAVMVERLLRTCDRERIVGRRNYVILLLLSRLGLRASEVARLRLEDVDWRRGEVVIDGKGARRDRLPLPVDVGRGLAEYLRCPRPQTASRAVFLKAGAPIGPISREVVGWIVRDACMRAGVPPVGPHRLRHTAATGMLHAGASLAEIGQVLRHRDIDTTAIYAKVDHQALRAIARPWPGEPA
jgi:site-specific recombinase XerD